MGRYAQGSSPQTNYNLRRTLSRKQKVASETSAGQIESEGNFRLCDDTPGMWCIFGCRLGPKCKFLANGGNISCDHFV
jgi:hypothetical protein